MSGAPKLDGRRAREIEAELRRRASAVLSGDGRTPPLGEIAETILAVAARIEEEVTRRLDMAPAKQADNFYTAAGIGRDPARPAVLPVAFVLAEGAKAVSSAPARTQLMVDADGPVIFETATRIDLAPGAIAALRGLDAEGDSIAIPSASVMAAKLPRVAPTMRRLRSGAAAGATKIQIDPASGLVPGALLQLGEGDASRHYLAAAVEGDLVTIEPGLEAALAENSPAMEVSDFRPFAASTRNHQSHALYIGHSKLLDIPSAVTIAVTGTALPAEAEWSWWGKLGEDDPPAWQTLTANQGAALSFTKPAGKPVKKKIRNRESLWLRARLPGRSAGSVRARDVRVAIGGEICTADKNHICTAHLDALNTGFEAIANTTPVVTNSPFHPFGREPRLYDSLYIGSDEAFSKAGADVSLCFGFGGPDFGPLAEVSDQRGQQIFALGAGNGLYRADFRSDPPTLLPVPQLGLAGAAPLEQPSLAAAIVGSDVWLAVGARGAVHVAILGLDSKLDQSSVKWVTLTLDAAHRSFEVDRVAFSGAPLPSLFAKAGPTLLHWEKIDGDSEPAQLDGAFLDVMPIQGAPGALLAIETVAAGLAVKVKAAGTLQFSDHGIVTDLPASPRTAWAKGGDPAAGPLYIAGYSEGAMSPIRLARIGADGTGATQTVGEIDTPVPLLFESPESAKAEARPTLIAAASQPTRFVWTGKASAGSMFRKAAEALSIGTSDRRDRAFILGSGRTIVQRADSGLLYRATQSWEDKSYDAGKTFATRSPGLPAGALYLTLGAAAANGDGFTLDEDVGGWRTIAQLPAQAPGAGGSTATVYAEQNPQKSGEIATTKRTVRLYEGPSLVAVPAGGEAADTAKTRAGEPLAVPGTEIDIMVSVDGAVQGIWRLTRASASTDSWTKPGGFPDSQPGPKPPRVAVAYVLLNRQAAAVPVSEAVTATVPEADQADFARLHSSVDPAQAPTIVAFQGDQALLLFPHKLLVGDALLLSAPPVPWRILGPGAAANPALSWEYWNGQSWWALGDDLRDDTANFQKGGGVFFKAPADMRSTDVAGRTRYWIRARLVGGDYGEPRVTVTTGPGPNGTTQQVATRDVSTVRAPYVTGLKLGYCALDPVRPEILLTEDSLGAVDQTSANEAGLEFPVFTPVGELMNPVSAGEAAAQAATVSESCDDPCPTPQANEPAPCDAPGAWQSCDSACIAPAGSRSPAGEQANGFVRGLMIGFSKPFAGETVSLYVDADPAGPPVELVADMLKDGRFAPINLVGDTSYGLTEPGILTLALPAPPDASELFDVSAHWLRLRPKGDGACWSPRLRAIHLNGVVARSIETRTMEQLGQSIGVADQEFRLTAAPVDPSTLQIRVRELLADEDKADPALDIANYPQGPTGDWVLWQASPDLIEVDAPARVYVVDAEAGLIRFGNGTTGSIPPLGADIYAARYAQVIGRKANGVAPGKQLSPLSSLAGVERVIALDDAAGGSDAEALESARRRAAAKVRHGGRILSRADLEDFAMTLSPGIAQVRAEKKGGGIRLVVAMAGAEPRPSPAKLRQFGAAIGEVSGFGISRPGGLKVVGPRLLPLAVDLVLRPRTPDLFAEAAAQAKAALADLFDPATGNHDGNGWPLGRLPDAQDIAAALAAIEDLALPEKVVLERADKEIAAERVLPATIPSDVLVRLDGVGFERAREAAA